MNPLQQDLNKYLCLYAYTLVGHKSFHRFNRQYALSLRDVRSVNFTLHPYPTPTPPSLYGNKLRVPWENDPQFLLYVISKETAHFLFKYDTAC